MAYYVHNKYDKASVDGLTTIGAGQTLVDYYTDYETYKYLDTSAGFGKVYDTLEYVTPNGTTGGGTGSGTGSHFNFASSIIVKSIQRGVSTANKVNINTVNPDKCFVQIQSLTSTSSAGLTALSSDKFTVKANGAYNFSWQVLEYR